MAEETDGIEEAFEGQLRLIVTAAAQVGEQMARQREAALREARAQSEQQHREMQSRIEAQRRAARVEMSNVYRSEWWQQASPEQISHAYQVSHAWTHEEPEAVRAQEHMRNQLKARYGIDANEHAPDSAELRERIRHELERAGHERATGEEVRNQSTAEHAEAQRLMALANQEEQQAEATRAAAEWEPDPEERAIAAAKVEEHEQNAVTARTEERSTYDSAERRAATAQHLESKGIDREVVATRMRADVSQAKPATEAVTKAPPTSSPKARASHGRVAQIQRGGVSR